jgi:phage repressor protein C with HTH and peptisase S24 domain
MSTFQERFSSSFDAEVKRRIEHGEPKLTKTMVWEAAKASSGAFTQWYNGATSAKLDNCFLMATLLRVNPHWLFDESQPREAELSQSVITARHPDDVLPDDMIEVMECKVSFSAGNGHNATYDLIEEREPATYRLSWFQRERINPAYVKRFKVTGDSMEPFLYSGDTVLVNLAENDSTRILDGKVYAIRYGDELRVKRLFRKLNGTLTLRSENPAYKDEDVDPETAQEHITIIGRVRDKGGSGGL